jgi:hypothetical protein
MTTIDRLKTPPMMVGGIVAGLLLLIIVAIVRSAGGATVAGAMQSNVGGAVGRPVQPQATMAALPVQQVVQVVQVVVTATPTRAPYNWLDVTVDVTGAWWVWADSSWVACGRIDASLNYHIESREPSWSTWYWLHANQRQAVYNRCLEVTQ